jgi:hypothetical protein
MTGCSAKIVPALIAFIQIHQLFKVIKLASSATNMFFLWSLNSKKRQNCKNSSFSNGNINKGKNYNFCRHFIDILKKTKKLLLNSQRC